MYLEIVTPEAVLFSGDVTSVVVPGVNGEFQMLDNHAPIVSILEKGIVSISAPSFQLSKEASAIFTKINDQNYTLAISSGTLEMKDNKVIILAD